MKHEILDAIRSAASFVLMIWGLIAASCTLVLLYAAWLGHIPVWHAPALALISMAILTGSYLLY